MNKIFCLLGLALMATDVFGSPAIKLRFELAALGMGETFFMDVPHTYELVKKKGYIIYTRPTNDRKNLDMYCDSNSLWACILLDSNGNPGGLQIAIQKGLIVNTTLDWETQGYTTWEAEENGTLKEFWTTTQYFISEEYMSLSAEERLEQYNSNKIIQNSVWLTGINKELMEVPDSVSGIKGCGFTEQNCVIWMGRHYFGNMTKDTECTSKTIFPHFLMERSGSIVGSGLNIVGAPDTSIEHKVMYEQPSKTAVEFIVNNGPQCLYDLAGNNGMVTMHIYYINDPYFNICILQ